MSIYKFYMKLASYVTRVNRTLLGDAYTHMVVIMNSWCIAS